MYYVVFILSLAAMCFFVFAKGEKDRSKKAEMETKPWMATVVSACGGVILGAVAWVIVGGLLNATIWELTPLYVGEVISVWAFGVAWRDGLGSVPGHLTSPRLTQQGRWLNCPL